MKISIFLLISFVISCSISQDNNFKDGDLIFQTSKSTQSKAIQIATKSKYSHMGIIYNKNGQLYVYEAVQPVKFTKLEDWIKRGEGSKFAVKRLKEADKLINAVNLKKLKNSGKKYLAKNYDIYFEWSDERIYCSELVWKMYNEVLRIEIGKLERLGDFELSHPIVRDKLTERFGSHIPNNEKVISPVTMFNSELLTLVYSNY